MKAQQLPLKKKASAKSISTAGMPSVKKKTEPAKELVHPFTVVSIGASAGGLEAITQLLKNLSPNTGMAFIYVQHLSPDHKSLLAPILSKVTTMVVQEIDDMEKMKPDNVYIIPYDKDIEVTDGHIKLIPRLRNKTANLSIDVLFSSLAETHKENVIGVVLSGSASDGTRGLREIKLAGGLTFAQDSSAKFISMPHSAIAAGVVDFVLSPKEIALKLNWISKHPQVNKLSMKASPEDEIENDDPYLKLIFQQLQREKGVDFGLYKKSTIKRRILRRLLIHRLTTIKQYTQYLTKNKTELDLLYQDLLINVTEFFRDKEAFDMLKKTIFPRLLKSKTKGETLRIWVAGCATGEEVYSIAMMLRELQGSKTNHIPFQIFASDLSASAISDARNAEYTVQQVKNVSPKRLQQFFTLTNGKYCISKSLREACIFAEHNVLRDPPFSKMDFISCRNLMIYLDHAAQKKLISNFHFSLNAGGCLLLGKSETIGTTEALFSEVNKRHKIYSKKKSSGISAFADVIGNKSSSKNSTRKIISKVPPKKNDTTHRGNLGIALDSALLAHYMPASVIINHDFEIMQFRGKTDLYLKHPTGKATFNVLKMARPEISFDLRTAIQQSIKTKKPVHKSKIEIDHHESEETTLLVNFDVSQIEVDGEEPLLMIVFSGQEIDSPTETKGRKSSFIAKDRKIKKLEEALATARLDLNSFMHDQEAVNEELQSANEEIVSSNEELQSLNEELETSKEEIESTNEELTTSNHELLTRNQQVEGLNSYFEVIQSTIQEPMLILDKEMRIRSANLSFYKTFHTAEEDCIGRSLYKLGDGYWNTLQIKTMLEDVVPNNNSFQNFELEFNIAKEGVKTMLLNAHRIIRQNPREELIVMTTVDVSEVRRLAIELQLKENKILEAQLEIEKKAKEVLTASNEYFRHLVKALPAAVYSCDSNGKITFYNDAAEKIWGRKPNLKKDMWCGSYKLFNPDGTLISADQSPMARCIQEGMAILGEEIIIERKNKSRSNVLVYPQPEFDTNGKIIGVIIMGFDVTEQLNAKNELLIAKNIAESKTLLAEEAVKSKQQFLSNMSHEIRTPMNAIIGFTKVVLKTDLTEKQKEYITAIKMSGDALIVLINDILDLAKVDSGKMTFEQTSFNLRESLSGMLRLFETKVIENNTVLEGEFDHSIPEILIGDPLRLRQIILNLLSNAVKFTEGGLIKLRVDIQHENATDIDLEFSVSDTGIGIPESQLNSIFQNFQQASTDTTKIYGGTGLGLAIVKQLVELQGGTISVESKLKKGSVFHFTLKFKKTPVIAKSGQTQKKTSLHQKKRTLKILVAEDVPLNQLLMKTILSDFGFNADIVENGQLAIDQLKSQKYDLVLMDIQMPVMNGFEATNYIRKTLLSNIPIIALTADVTTVDTAKCREAGMNDYVSKPIDEKELYDKIISSLN